MEDVKQIKLNIWGTRGGFRSFCHSDDLLIEEPEIKNTWKDIRDFVFVSDLNVRFYALEFTPNYKVYTLYRPVNDTSRSGAYVATTLYVPHALKVMHILDLLKKISDAYHKDHYDAFGNPNTNPDYVQIYLEIMKGFAENVVREDMARPWSSSVQDNVPRILPFSSLSVVENFFETPYRLEFLDHQEIMFWDDSCLSKQSGVEFQKKETLSLAFPLDGGDISEQFQGGLIKGSVPSGIQIVSFKREGVDVTQNWQSCRFFENTHIEIELAKAYQEPFKYEGVIGGSGRCPFLKQGVDFMFKSVIDFKPRTYQVSITTSPFIPLTPFELFIDGQTVSIKDGKGTFSFTATKPDIKVSLKNGVFVKEFTSIKLSSLFVGGSETPVSSYTITGLKKYRFHFQKECSGQIFCGISPIEFKTASHNDFDVVLPDGIAITKLVVEGFDAQMEKHDDLINVTLLEKVGGYQGNNPNKGQPHGTTNKGATNYGGRGTKKDPSWFSEHKKMVLVGAIALVLLVVGLIIGISVGKNRPVYNIQLQPKYQSTKIDSIFTNEVVDEGKAKVVGNQIELYKGWEKVVFVIQTEDEGTCEPITIENSENFPHIQYGGSRYSYVIKENKQIVITFTSPDWAKLDDLKGVGLKETITELATIAKNSNSVNIKNECVQRADNIVINTNYDNTNYKEEEFLSLFIEEFEGVQEANRLVAQYNDKIKEISEEESSQILLNDFREKLKIVYSCECTLNAIKELEEAYNKVIDKEERFDIINAITKVGTKNVDWFKVCFIPMQKSFFGIFKFTPTPEKAKGKIDDYLSKNNQLYFSEEQRKVMKKLLDSDTFKTLKNNRDNNIENNNYWKIYHYIKTGKNN